MKLQGSLPLASVLLSVSLFSVSPISGVAQQTVGLSSDKSLWVGYSARPTDQMLGGGVVWFPPVLPGWGVLLDGRLATNRPQRSEIREGTVQEALAQGDQVNRPVSTWSSASLALLRALTPQFGLYVGAVASRGTVYVPFLRVRQTLEGTLQESYWVEDDREADDTVGAVFGALYHLTGRVGVQFGGQTAPKGMVVGGYVRLF